MNNKDIINDIENNLSKLLSVMKYSEYVKFIKNNNVVSLYDQLIDNKTFSAMFNKNFLNKVNNILIKKIKEYVI